ncbi:MAG: hypothetical protein EXS37_08150 [Opitutus sp.]|nr:hypothetical protein [Opitutus sp.]
MQWTRLPGGEVTPDVRARFLKLWSQRAGVVVQPELEAGRPRAGQRDEGVASPAMSHALPKVGRALRARLLWATAVLAVLGAGGCFGYRAYVARRAAMIRAVLGQSEPIKKESRVLVARFVEGTGCLDQSEFLPGAPSSSSAG